MTADVGRDVRVFADSDSLRAFEAITRRRPDLIVLEALFAATRRGAELIHRITTDPRLSNSQIRVLSPTSDYSWLFSQSAAPGSAPGSEVPGEPIPPAYWGTRQSNRLRIRDDTVVRLDGNPATLVDLSPTGAQVIVPKALRPSQRVRLLIADGHNAIRLAASVVWSAFESSRAKGYRAGLEFINAEPEAVEAFWKWPLTRECLDALLDPRKAISDKAEALDEYLARYAATGAQGGSGSPGVRKAALDQLYRSLAGNGAVAARKRKLKAVLRQIAKASDSRDEQSSEESLDCASLRKLPRGSPVVIKNHDGEHVVSLVSVKRTRFVARYPNGRIIDVPVEHFLRPHEGEAP